MNRGREQTYNSLFDSQFTFRLTIHFSTQNSLFDSQFTLDRATSQHTLQQMATTEHIRGNVVHYQARNGAQSEAMTARGGQSFSLSLLTQDPIPPAGQSGWAPGYENSIFMPKLRFTKAEGFVQ